MKIATADSPRWLSELEPTAEELMNRHLATSREWFPHQYVPWSLGRDFDGPLGGEPWHPEQSALAPAVCSALVVNLLTEDNLPGYHWIIAGRTSRDGAWGAWLHQWTAEEDRHAAALRGYLHAARAVDPVALERARARDRITAHVEWTDARAARFVERRAQALAVRARRAGASQDPTNRTPMTITTAGTSAADIAFHYDLGNDFYALWLDETLAYTAAKWDGIPRGEPDATALLRAQRAKLDHHLDLVGARPGDGLRLLDVGCGWGAMLEHAGRDSRIGEAVGLTISAAQYDYLTARALPGAEPRLESWEDHVPARPYDAIVSMGAFEHFATAGMTRAERLGGYARYFEACHRWLRPGGRMSLQTIAYDGAYDGTGPIGEFVGSDVFPSAKLPRLTEIAAACDPYFSVVVLTASAEDYVRTLASWSARLLRARERAERLVGPEGYRRYRRYLRASEVTFLRGGATLYRIGFRRRDEPLRLPA